MLILKQLAAGVSIFVFTSLCIMLSSSEQVPNFMSRQNYYEIPNFFKLRFIYGTTMGLYLAVVLPIDLPGREAYLGWFFEAIHSTPSNQTSFEYPPLVSRDIERQVVYEALESKIKSSGYPGKPCLLRIICEVSMYSVEKSNGVLGDLLHVILTPSTTKNAGLSPDYSKAEFFGRSKQDCSNYYDDCGISLISLISWVDDIF